MKISDPVKNQDTGQLEINFLNITVDEVVWLRSAIKSCQDKGDPNDYNKLKHARDWMDTVHSAFKTMRPS